MLLFITAVSVVLIVSFMCSIFESVLLSVRRPQIEVMSRKHKHAAALLKRFKQNIDVPIAAILILNTAAHTIGAAVAGASYSNVFMPGTLWIFSIVFTLAVLLFTEIIPKTVGVSYATRLATPVAYGIQWLTVVLYPLVWVSEKISRSLRSDSASPVTSVEEIRLMATLGRSEGAVGPRTAEMIVGATHLRHLQARDVILPRDEIHFLSARMSRAEVESFIRETGHSRFPFSTTRHIDDLSGVVLAKVLLNWLLEHDDEDIDWSSLCKDPLIVPATTALPELLHTFQGSRRHMAIVVDEYGDVEGIVTLEDVLEEIVGDIRDEHDLPADDFLEQEDGHLVIRAQVDMRKLSARLGIVWDHELGVTTVGGLLTERLERIPQVGDAITWNGYRIEVLRADRRKARLLVVSKAN
jgi:CBS domain containing-hemolysin-like protein